MDRIERIAELIAQQEKPITRKALLRSAMAAGVSMTALAAALEARGVEAAHDEALPQARTKTIRVQGIYRPGSQPGGVGKPIHQMADVAKQWEARNPGYTIKFEPDPVLAAGQDEAQWIKTQLLGGIAPDLFNFNQENAWPDADKGWYYTFDSFLNQPNPYVSGHPTLWQQYRYPDIVKGHYGPDNKQYAVDYDMVEVAIFYNKNHFAKAGITRLPQTWAEMIALNQKLQKAGIQRPTIGNAWRLADWGVDIIFDQLFRPFDKLLQAGITSNKTRQSKEYSGYLLPKAMCRAIKMGYLAPDNPRFREVMRILHDWRQYFTRDLGPFMGGQSLEHGYRDFVTEKGSMLWDGNWNVRALRFDPLLKFKVGTFYLPPITRQTSPFAAAHPFPACRIGGIATAFVVSNTPIHNGNITKVLDYIHFLCTPQHAGAIIGEAAQFIPNITGAPTPPGEQIFDDVLRRPYTIIKNTYWGDTQYNDEIRSQNLNYLNDGISLDTYMQQLGRSMQAVADRYIKKYGWEAEAKSWTPANGIKKHPEIARPGSV